MATAVQVPAPECTPRQRLDVHEVTWKEILAMAEIKVLRDYKTRDVKCFGYGDVGNILSGLFHPVDDIAEAEIILCGLPARRVDQLGISEKLVVLFDTDKDPAYIGKHLKFPWENDTAFDFIGY